jgi:UDP-N-acetylmuramate dehydrogenase
MNRSETIPLSSLTTFRLGGPSTVITVEGRDGLPAILGGGVSGVRWLGKGANLLVSDAGSSLPIARLGAAFAQIEVRGQRDGRTIVAAGAAADLAVLISRCVAGGLAGPEGLAGVPATVGGALRMNAGTSTCWMLDYVARCEVVLPGEDAPRWIERAAMPAAYRSCGLPPGTVFLGCELELAPGDPETLRATAGRLKKAKAASQPLALPSAGCVFKNPRPDLPAGKLIDQLGLKGTRIGGCTISPVHGNFIVNDHDGAAADVCALVRLIRSRAWTEAGVDLRMEVETWDLPDDLRAPPGDLGVAA